VQNLKQLRTAAALTQTQLAHQSRVPRWKIAKIEAGFRKSPLTAAEQHRVIEALLACAAENVDVLQKRIPTEQSTVTASGR
jgi:predicted transcriptional regulator